MKKILQTGLIVIFAILLFLFLPPLYVWVKGGGFEISSEEIRNAVLLGIITPVLVLLSRRIKNNFLFIFIAIAIIVAVLFFVKFIFNV